MCKKFIYLIFGFLVLGVLLPGIAGAADPNLVGWWKFDEGSGTVAQDSSGYDNHGTITNAQWVAGFAGAALNINAVGYVDVPAKAWSTIQKQVTVAFWAYGDPSIQPQNHFTFGAFQDAALNDARVASCHIPWGNGNVYWDTGGTSPASGYDRINKAATPAEYEGRWQHWALTKNATTGEQRIYLNGVLWHSGSGLTRTMTGVTAFTIGDRPAHDSPYAGMIDDFRLYNRAMTEAELKVLAARPKAYDPVPANGAEGVTTPVVQWTAGTFAAFHDVYFGTNPTPGPAEYKGRQGYAVYWAGTVTPGTIYYWRVDEVEADGTTIHTGDVWSFTAQPLTAWNPKPANGATNVFPVAQLSWGAGMGATKHHLYFGDIATDVDNGTGGTDKGERLLSETTYSGGPLYPETTYYWRVDEYSGATWLKGDTWSFTTSGGGSGVMLETWLNIGGGTTIPDLTGNARYPDNPDTREVVNIFEGPTDSADNYGSRLYGWLMPPESGDYTFWIATDDAGQLWLSTDVDPANKVMIASVSGWVGSRDFDNASGQGGTNQKSAAKSLVKGQRYYIEGLMKEGGGGDNIAVAWQGGTITTRQVIAGSYVSLAPFAPVRAYGPTPANLATEVTDTPTLRWLAGEKAAKHDVYLGTDATAVANATTASTGIYRGQQNLAATSYVPTEVPLKWNTTYYWRIDEVNPAVPGGPWKGAVWSFTTANYLLVDDFEGYTDDVGSRIFQTWKDGWGYTEPAPGYPGNGTGSAVGYSQAPFAEQSIVHGGGQSMPLAYDNTGTTGKARYSETFREWTSPQDWTRNNVKALTLYVQGTPPDFMESPPGTFTMSAEGTDIWGASDEFRYVYKRLSGDGEIIARVDRIAGPGTNEWAKAGVMIRETLDPTSFHAFMAVTPLASHGLAFQFRHEAGDSDSEHGVDVQTAPYWVKVVRKGNVFTGYHSPDGINWTMKSAAGDEIDAMNPVTITMGTNVYIGLALTSHENDVLRMAQFSNVSTSGSVTGAWTVADIAETVTGTNSIEPLYVALEDNAAHVKVVANDNPLASVEPSWQEWNIDLAQFSGAGVNLKAIKKMYIGLGNRTTPKAGGTGTIFVDDIRAYPSRCVDGKPKPAADLSGDCVVDYADLDIMANDWLASGAGLAADLRQDNAVNFKDFAVLADSWLEEILWP